MYLRGGKGFSLIEVIVVMAIIGIITAIATPSWLQWRAKTKLRGAVNNFISDLQFARINAVREQSEVALVITGNTTYQVFKGECGTLAGGFPPAGSEVYRNRILPAGVSIELLSTTPFSSNHCTGYNLKGRPTKIGTTNFIFGGQKKKAVVLNIVGRIRKVELP